MNFCKRSITPLCVLFAGLMVSPLPAARAQQEAGNTSGPSKYLYLTNVVLKPNQGGAYAKLESQEIDALRAAKAPSHYMGLWSVTGGNHVLFLHGFDSFAELQKAHDDTAGMKDLMAKLGPLNEQEGALEVERHTSIYSFEKDLSLNVGTDLSKMRFMRILLFHVRSGHGEDFEHLVKQVIKTYQASIPDAKWAMFQKMYGQGSDRTYILVTPMESLGTVDDMISHGKKYSDSVGEDQQALFRKALAADVESEEADLFAFGPRISYVPDSWLSSSPDFWGKK